MEISITSLGKEIVKHFFKKLHLFIGIIFLIVAGPQVVLAQWSTNSKVNNAVCVLPGNQDNSMVTVDGAGGAIVTWADYRNGNFSLYAQRINAAGVTQWAANGVQVCNIANDAGGASDRYRLIADGTGGAYLIWHDSRSGTNRDIYGQRINSSGVVQWAANGIAIAATGNDESPNEIVSDGAGGVIVTWTNGLGYAQRINSSGALLWGAAGQNVGTMAPNGTILTVSDGAGGAIMVWEGANSGLFGQRFNSAGNKQWAANGVTIYSGPDWDFSGVTTDGASGAVVLWEKNLGVSKNVHYAQKINAAGALQWTAAGVPVVTVTASTRNQAYGLITTDMAGGAFIAWINGSDQMTPEQVYVQHINQAGTMTLDANGVRLSQTTERQMTPAMVSDNSGGAIISWADRRSGFSVWDIYAQRINEIGTRLWPSEGLPVIEADENQTEVRLVSDGNGGAFFTGGWDFRNNLSESDIYVQKVCANGTMGICAPDPAKPDMRITYRGFLTIQDGETTPSLTYGTDFGDVFVDSFLVREFFIVNPSDVNLVILETTITGPDSSSYLHGMVYGAVTIPPHDSTQLNVMLSPSYPGAPGTPGVKNATVNLITNVAGKNPYTFAIRGNAVLRGPGTNCQVKRYYWDDDKDGYGGGPDFVDRNECDTLPPGFVQNGLDCDDKNPAVNPAATEICNGLDDNCDGRIDEGFTRKTFYHDSDGDGFGNPAVFIVACAAPKAYVLDNRDCNDNNDQIHPGAIEKVNGKDDDCDGLVDEASSVPIYWLDLDGDGYGGNAVSTSVTDPPAGYVNNNLDCYDAHAAINPGAPEIINGIDDNCNGQIDETTTLKTFYRDADGDQYGNLAVTTTAAAAPTGYVANSTDCDDTKAAIHPGAQELCNGIDDDCDGQIDEGVSKTTFYRDADGDGYGNPAVTTQSCTIPAGYVNNNTDCNDASATIHPGAQEICNGIDDDCDGQIDDNAAQLTFYRDADGDGYGNAALTTTACNAPTGYVNNNTDCNDANAAVHPGATEICNSIDDDCDGQIDEVGGNTSVSVGDDAKSYFGYLPDQCITKTATVTNGVAPYSYFWTIDRPLLSNVVTADGDETMTGINSQTVEVCLLDTASLCVTVTDANGCTFTGCASIFAADVRCFADNSGGQKINICHEGTTICINQNDLAEHLAHGDYIGACVAGFTMYPNPSQGELKLSLSLPDNTSSGEVQIVNSYGLVVQRIAVGPQQNIINVTINQSGLYLVRLIVNKQTFTQQVMVVR